MTEQHRYYLLLAVAFFVGLYFAASDFHCPDGSDSILCQLLPEVPKKIGDALIIAPLLALIVDEAAKRKLMKEFSLDISSHIIGRLLPVPLREHLHKYLQMFLVRTRWDITYRIEKWEGQSSYIKLSTSFDYDMENYSKESITYNFLYSVEDSCYPEIGLTEITHVRMVDRTYDEDSLKPEVVAENGYQKFSQPIVLQPHGTPRKPVYTFLAESIECFRDTGFSPFLASYPVLTATLSVWHEKKDFRVSLELTYDDVNHGAKREELTEGDKTGTKWTIKGPILPGQGFLVRWDAIQPASKASVGAAAL